MPTYLEIFLNKARSEKILQPHWPFHESTSLSGVFSTIFGLLYFVHNSNNKCSTLCLKSMVSWHFSWQKMKSANDKVSPYLSALDFCHSLVEIDICSSLKLLRCSLVFETRISQATAGINIKFSLEKTQLHHNLIFFKSFCSI